MSLLVVPPTMAAGAGDDAMSRAAGAGNVETPAALLAAFTVRPGSSIPGPRRPGNVSARSAGPR